MRNLSVLWLLVACWSSSPCGLLSVAGGSGDQYELSCFGSAFFGGFWAAFLVGELFLGFAIELCCTLETFGAEVWMVGLMVGMDPRRADLLMDIAGFTKSRARER